VLSARPSTRETREDTSPTLGTSDGDGAESLPEQGGVAPLDITNNALTIRDLESMLRNWGCSGRKAKVGARAAFQAMGIDFDEQVADAPDEPAAQLLHNALARLRSRT
jgi:hypothetical protein